MTSTTIFTILTATLLLFLHLVPTDSSQFSRTLSRQDQTRLGLTKKGQKLSHIHFFFHEIVSVRNATSVRVAEAPVTNSSATGFGVVAVMDDPLTIGPEMSSKMVGKAQGVYALADQSVSGIIMAFTFVLTEGEFNGSTLSVLGRNEIMQEVTEMPVVGGSGVFRFARGYAEARTHMYNLKTGDAVVEFNVYVFHH